MSSHPIQTICIPNLGYVKYIGHMGSDESFVEAARMSTGKGFFGWYWGEDTYSDCMCKTCLTHHLLSMLPRDEDGVSICTNCWEINIALFDEDDDWKEIGCPEPKILGRKGTKRDLSLLETLYSNRHQTPFEMGELCIEVEAPIFVFREWHRHRTQSYNEFSARYSQMPNKHYLPLLSRMQKQSKTNKQGSAEEIQPDIAADIIFDLKAEQTAVYENYGRFLKTGLAKEIARINTPVSRISKMRAKTDIRNWLAFLGLRMEMSSQWEIRQYANAVASVINKLFPKTFQLFLEYDLMGTRFSRTEMRFLSMFYKAVSSGMTSTELIAMNGVAAEIGAIAGLDQKQMTSILTKLTTNKEELYKDMLENL